MNKVTRKQLKASQLFKKETKNPAKASFQTGNLESQLSCKLQQIETSRAITQRRPTQTLNQIFQMNQNYCSLSDPCRSSVPVCRNSSPKSSDVNVGLMFKFPSSTNELLRLLAYHWNSPSYSTHNTFFSIIRQTDLTELIPGRR